jgi:hypothetical protein
MIGMARNPAGPQGGQHSDSEHDGGEDDLVESWLDSLSYDDLAAEVIALADSDAGIRAVLQARAGAQTAKELIEDGAPDEAVDLAREAFAQAARSASGAAAIPDSFAAAARELLDAHLLACRAEDPPPDPVALGTYLADLLLEDATGLTPSLEDYGELLGRDGTLAIRDRITAVYQANPGHANARHLAGSLAGPARNAVLRDRRNRHREMRSLDSYRALRAAARQVNTWHTERIAALAQLQASALVEALLDDGDTDYAWAALPEALAGEGAEDLRLRVADASVATHPAKALGVYQAAIEPLVRQTGDAAYARLVRLLASARTCHEMLGTTEEFGRYLAGLRETCKRKRNLITLLDEAGL